MSVNVNITLSEERFPLPVPVSGVQLAVFRGEDGQAHVLDAYCPHLGANLAVGGRVLGGCLECPFHSWIFQGSDGKCVKIPYTEKGLGPHVHL